MPAADRGHWAERAMPPRIDGTKSLDELDPPAWGEPAVDSYLVVACHRLRQKPIGCFAVEDLRIMIGQGIGLPWLVPLALEVLERDPLAAGDLYPGDLLSTVLQIPEEYWRPRLRLNERIDSILQHLPQIEDGDLQRAIASFRNATLHGAGPDDEPRTTTRG